jgi:hypothetical protein
MWGCDQKMRLLGVFAPPRLPAAPYKWAVIGLIAAHLLLIGLIGLCGICGMWGPKNKILFSGSSSRLPGAAWKPAAPSD